MNINAVLPLNMQTGKLQDDHTRQGAVPVLTRL